MNQNDKPQIKESASATTSSEENKSGSFAYIVFGITALLLVLLAVVCGGCVSAIVTTAAMEGADGSGAMTYDDLVGDGSQEPDLDDLLEYYNEQFGDQVLNYKDTDNSYGTCSVKEALDFDLAFYTTSLGNVVSASSYANTPSSVRDFVRSTVKTDDDYNTKIVNCLNAASRNDDKQQEQIEKAIGLCDEASKAIDGIEVPSVSTDKDGVVKDALGTAKTDAAKRWETTKAELSLLKTTDKINKKTLWDLDEETIESVESAAGMLEDAMETAAKAK